MKKFFKVFVAVLLFVVIDIFLYLLQPEHLGLLIILNVFYIIILFAIRTPNSKSSKTKTK